MTSLSLREKAERDSATLPALLAQAEHLATAVLSGNHGRRRAGIGDDFWQYRPIQVGDSLRMIDHRRSAMGDVQFVREREWQIAQSVMIWIDRGASMRFASNSELATKADRARLFGLALSILLVRGGERIGLAGTQLPPRAGSAQISRLAEILLEDKSEDYTVPEHHAMIPHAKAVYVSDFMGEIDNIRTTLTKAADRGVRGILYHVLDPIEEAFPFRGRAIFQSVGGTFEHETLKASGLKEYYLERLAKRKDELKQLCSVAGWQYGLHHTNSSTQSGLLWLWRAIDGGRGSA